jgi:hypothetical protein
MMFTWKKIPDRLYFSHFYSVILRCPAFGPWKRAIISYLEVRTSTIFPFPSSPHCNPSNNLPSFCMLFVVSFMFGTIFSSKLLFCLLVPEIQRVVGYIKISSIVFDSLNSRIWNSITSPVSVINMIRVCQSMIFHVCDFGQIGVWKQSTVPELNGVVKCCSTHSR